MLIKKGNFLNKTGVIVLFNVTEPKTLKLTNVKTQYCARAFTPAIRDEATPLPQRSFDSRQIKSIKG